MKLKETGRGGERKQEVMESQEETIREEEEGAEQLFQHQTTWGGI